MSTVSLGYSIKNQKAMVGALFLELCAFCLFYVLDEIKEIAPQYQFIDAADAAAEE